MERQGVPDVRREGAERPMTAPREIQLPLKLPLRVELRIGRASTVEDAIFDADGNLLSIEALVAAVNTCQPPQEQKEHEAARGDGLQPQRLEPPGSTAVGNEVRDGSCPQCGSTTWNMAGILMPEGYVKPTGPRVCAKCGWSKPEPSVVITTTEPHCEPVTGVCAGCGMRWADEAGPDCWVADLHEPAVARKRLRDLGLDTPAPLPLPEQERTQGAWQPIDTAPKDYTNVLLFVPGVGVVIGCWLSIGKEWCWSDVDDTQPTHWMPLPAAPGQPSPAQKG